MGLKVAVSGAPGAGKSSVVKTIVETYGWKTADVGQIFRKRAMDKGLTIAEYDKLIEQNPDEDRAMDEDFKKLVSSSEEDIIVSWRLGFHFMPDIISIYLDVDPKEGARRIFNDDRGNQEKKYSDITDALKASTTREERFRKRFMNIYGIDFMDKSNYTKVIDTTNKSLDEVVDKVIKFVNQYK